MVVVSGSWVKNVATYPAPTNNDDMVIPTNTMTAKAVLICRPNSHPFQERTLCLDQPIKIGRSVARARATPNNAIFDCKVLSRHHALLWYDCGKFYLQDTKSSNGTFVNNNRLSSSETEPHEVSSGDIVQFGVDVVENNRKVTHGCIIATLKLYLPDGKEAKASLSITEGNRHGFVPLDELYKLNQIIQEALQREQCLETKLGALQRVVDEARKSADQSWQAYVGEERLLSRIATLESQLMQAGKNYGEDRLREELNKLQEDRVAYQVAAKESLQKLISERLEAVGVAAEHERARATAEQETILAREDLEKTQKEIQELAQKLSEEQRKNDEERENFEHKLHELEEKLDAEKLYVIELQHKLEYLKSLAINPVQELLPLEELEEKCNLFIENDLKLKEEMIGENDVELDLNRTNGINEPQNNHINKVVALSPEQIEVIKSESDLSEIESREDIDRYSNDSLFSQETLQTCEEENVKYSNESDKTNVNSKDSLDNADELEISSLEGIEDKETQHDDNVYSKTLKYQFHTAQNEVKRQMEMIKQYISTNERLENSLKAERTINAEKAEQIEKVKQELCVLEQKWKDSCNEAQHLRNQVSSLKQTLCFKEAELEEKVENEKEDSNGTLMKSPSLENDKNISLINVQQFAALEEELVVMKESYAQLNEEKLMLNKNLLLVREQYQALCNRSYNTMFCYIAPFVLIVLYLLMNSIFS